MSSHALTDQLHRLWGGGYALEVIPDRTDILRGGDMGHRERGIHYQTAVVERKELRRDMRVRPPESRRTA